MSRASRLGYDGEAPLETLLRARYGEHGRRDIYRPRAGAPRDKGDIGGLPLVISVKNQQNLNLGGWIADLGGMVTAADRTAGVVWHKRRHYGDPRDWYVTTTGRLFLPILDAFVEVGNS